MKFHVIYPQPPNPAQSPIRVVEQTTGREVSWINRYLDREYVRRLAAKTLRIYAHNLLHFIRWWESVHHTGDVLEGDLTESTLLERRLGQVPFEHITGVMDTLPPANKVQQVVRVDA